MKKIIFPLLAIVIVSCGVKKSQFPRSPLTANPEFPKFDREAHRGGRGIMPENSIPAMLHTIDLGLTTLEMDSRLTSDGKVIIFHDDYLNPAWILGPKGVEMSAKEELSPFQMTYSELKKYDIGSKINTAFPQQKKMKVGVPLLADVIDSVQNYLKRTGKTQVFYNIETKSSESGDGKVNPIPEVFVKAVMDIIEQKGITPYVVIQSFDKRTLQVLNKKYPYVKTAYLIGNDKKTVEENVAELGFNPFIYSPIHTIVNEVLMKACHDKGIKVVAWTPNTKEDIDRLKALGIDGIITDYPELLL